MGIWGPWGWSYGGVYCEYFVNVFVDLLTSYVLVPGLPKPLYRSNLQRNCPSQLYMSGMLWYVCIVSLCAFLGCTHWTRFSATTMQRAQDVTCNMTQEHEMHDA